MTESVPELRVRLTKRPDGAVVLQCIRRDGTATWQRHDKHALFFSFHDLTHFAVETGLGFRKGFYGLIVDGWDIADMTGKGARGRLPAEAILVEHLVGLFDRERLDGSDALSADEFNAQLDQMMATNHPEESRRVFADTELADVRKRIDMLHRDWTAVIPGSTLELSFH